MPQGAPGRDHFKLGLLLIKVGAIVSFVIPLLILAGISWTGIPLLSGPPGVGSGITAIFSSFIILGFVFAVVALYFYREIAAGKSSRIMHAIILGVLMLFLSSNVGGLLVLLGAILCYTSKKQ